MSTTIETPIFTPSTTATATTSAQETVTEVQPQQWEALFESSQARVKELEAVMAAARINQAQTPKDDSRPVLSAERVKSMLGTHALNSMTHNQRLASLGLPPDAYSRDFLLKAFGRGADGAVGNELFRSSPRKYREAREAALITQAYGASS